MFDEVLVQPRFYLEGLSLTQGARLQLPDGAARHVQVLRSQPGDVIRVFDGLGREHIARVTEMGRKSVEVEIGEPINECRELPIQVTLALGMPANDRMDFLIEKAAELGVAAIQPLMCARSVLKLDGDRAAKKVAHWQGVAAAACEQSRRSVVPRVAPVATLQHWLKSEAASSHPHRARGVLSLREAVSVNTWLSQTTTIDAAHQPTEWVFLSGPEGGLAPEEENLALSMGWSAVSLGRRVLRADTAPLAVLSILGSKFEG